MVSVLFVSVPKIIHIDNDDDDDDAILQNGRRSFRNPGDGRPTESETARVGERASAPSAHQEFCRTWPERQEQQPLHWPRTMHGTSQDIPAGSSRGVLLKRRTANAGETACVVFLHLSAAAIYTKSRSVSVFQ